MKHSKWRTIVAVVLIVVFSGLTACLGWYSLAGCAMLYGFFVLTPIITFTARTREVELSLTYVGLSWAIYQAGLILAGYYAEIGENTWRQWLFDGSGAGAKDELELLSIGLVWALFISLMVHYGRKSEQVQQSK